MSSLRYQWLYLISLALFLAAGIALTQAVSSSSFAAATMGAIALIGGIVFTAMVLRGLRRNLRAALGAASSQTPGDEPGFAHRLDDEFYRLGQRLDELAQRYENKFDELRAERSRLRAVLDNMIEGVILCDEVSTILVANASFLRLFRLQESPRDRKIFEVCRVPEVLELSSQIGRSEELLTDEFTLGTRTIRTTFVPLPGVGGYLAVFHDITEMRRVDQIRRDFVANVSHELRTPLASIEGYSESLLDGALDDPEVATKFVDTIHRNAERLSMLVKDLLDLSRIESGRIRVNFTPADLYEATQAAVYGIGRIKAKEQVFVNAIPKDMSAVTDREIVVQILVNLIENASKYTPPGSEIRVEAEEKPDATIVRVVDNGPGIPAEDLPRIFERFYRGDKSRNAAGEPGTGLGLSICKHLAAEIKGALDVESGPKGTTFSLSLPRK